MYICISISAATELQFPQADFILLVYCNLGMLGKHTASINQPNPPYNQTSLTTYIRSFDMMGQIGSTMVSG